MIPPARIALIVALFAGLVVLPAAAQASDVQHLHYRFGPITITPGTNVNTVFTNLGTAMAGV